MIMAGDRGMITKTRIKDLRELPGMDWITALKAPAITALTRDGGQWPCFKSSCAG